jgi:hypothetical protein
VVRAIGSAQSDAIAITDSESIAITGSDQRDRPARGA